MKKDIYKRFEIIEGHLPVYRSELYKLLETNEQASLQKIKEIKDATELTIQNNFRLVDERIDKFSELVDTNLQGIRNALAENREVYVSALNKSNLINEENHNKVVDDLEIISDSLNQIQETLGNAQSDQLHKLQQLDNQLIDLEQNLNTQLVTEKTLRAAHDKQLAEEIDKLRKVQAMAEGKGMALQKADKETNDNNFNLIEDTRRQIDGVAKTISEVTEIIKELQTNQADSSKNGELNQIDMNNQLNSLRQ